MRGGRGPAPHAVLFSVITACQREAAAMDDEYDLVRAQLRLVRENAGLTQRQLAEKLRKPQSYVAKNESKSDQRGQSRRIDPIELYYWCRACETTAEEFMAQLARDLEF